MLLAKSKGKEEADVREGELTTTELGVKTANVASFVAVSKGLNLIIGGITFVIVARLLGANNYGIYTLAISTASLVGILSNISVNNYYNKFIPTLLAKKDWGKIGQVLGDGIVLLLLAGVLFTVIGLLISGYVAGYVFHTSADDLILQVAFLSIIVSALSGALTAALISFGSGKSAAAMTLTNAVFQSGVSIGLVLLGFGALGAITGWLIGLVSGVVGGLLLLARISAIKVKLSGLVERSKPILLFSVPLLLASIIGVFLTNWPAIFLGLLSNPAVVGAFGVGNKIGTFIDVISGSITIVLAPTFAAAIASNEIKKRIHVIHTHTLYFSFLLLLPVIIYLAVLAQQFVVTIFASSYANAALYMALIAIATPFTFIWSYGQGVAIGFGDVNKVFKYFVAVVIATVVALFALVPFFKAVGTIIAVYYIGMIVGDVLFLNYMRKTAGLKYEHISIGKLLLPSIALVILLYLVTLLHVRPLYELAIGVLVVLAAYPPLVVLTKGIGEQELAILHKVSQRVPFLGTLLGYLLAYAEAFRR